MGTGNITISGNNASVFEVYNFTGVSGQPYSIYNNTTVVDGLVELTLSYNDNATNTATNATQFYVDNTNPTSFSALTAGTNTSSSTHTVQVSVTDNLMTNSSMTLHYKRGRRAYNC